MIQDQLTLRLEPFEVNIEAQYVVDIRVGTHHIAPALLQTRTTRAMQRFGAGIGESCGNPSRIDPETVQIFSPRYPFDPPAIRRDPCSNMVAGAVSLTQRTVFACC